MNATAPAVNPHPRLWWTPGPGSTPQKTEIEQTTPFSPNRINKTGAPKPISKANKWVLKAILKPLIRLETHFSRTLTHPSHAHRMIESEAIQ
jgi:hypothetical protein